MIIIAAFYIFNRIIFMLLFILILRYFKNYFITKALSKGLFIRFISLHSYFKRSGFCFRKLSQPVYAFVSAMVPELK